MKLKMCLDNIDNDFIERCLDVDILEIIKMDTRHKYSDNMKLILKNMFIHSKNILIEQINKTKTNRIKR